MKLVTVSDFSKVTTQCSKVSFDRVENVFLINNRATTLKVVTDILAVPRVSALAPEAGKMRDPGNEVGIIVVLNFFLQESGSSSS